ncbi:50S ribosomal protein L11 methyltransferase [Methyloligella sp. 2.7D]|uniref:50S ribosomal protein L11 methyltransferase n=1 Tax=unclassified Methyloligella TaxID=2625955 RepID=UPI00157D2AA0|nr:50S ribosomal protein L11 methyltransferase [Methyloligella sp. GL2]QKP77979.1 50S ribosomal protein L11 methyltransferase [Methyloligella sp. GL2]
MTIEAPTNAAARIASALEEFWPAPDAVGLFEKGPELAEVFAHYSETPDMTMLEALVAAAADGEMVGPLRIEEIPNEDWVTLSQGQRGRVAAGRFLVHGSHEPIPPRRGVIEIDASQAFGTAHHASTKGCLMALDAVLKYRQPRTVADIGTGSGLLAIAAAKETNARVLASDNDEIAVRIAEENAQINGTPHIRFVTAEGFAHPTFLGLQADLIFGNLLKSILFALTPGFARHTAPGGLAILSGLTEDQAPSVEARFGDFGFMVKRRFILDGWATLLLCRRSAGPLSD